METGRRVVSGMDPHHTDASVGNGHGRRKDDRLSLSRIVGMFIASVTVSVITTKLTSYLGSIIIVGLSSVLLAVFNALYERFFKASRKAAAKAILNMPHNDVLPDKVAGHLQEIVIEDTETIPPVINQDTAPAGDAESSPADHAGHEDADSTPSVDEDGDNDDANDGTMTDGEGSGHWHVRALVESMSPVVKTIIIILLFALTTSLISWGVATVVEKPDVTNVTVKESKVEKLSQEEKDAIKSAAAAEVSNQIKQAQNSADAANGSTSDLNKRMSSLEKRISEMQNTIDSIQKQESGQQPATSDINALKQQLAQMQEELNALKNQQPSPSPSSGYGSGGTMNNGNGSGNH